MWRLIAVSTNDAVSFDLVVGCVKVIYLSRNYLLFMGVCIVIPIMFKLIYFVEHILQRHVMKY